MKPGFSNRRHFKNLAGTIWWALCFGCSGQVGSVTAHVSLTTTGTRWRDGFHDSNGHYLSVLLNLALAVSEYTHRPFDASLLLSLHLAGEPHRDRHRENRSRQ